jgi:hypothetical protein
MKRSPKKVKMFFVLFVLKPPKRITLKRVRVVKLKTMIY